MPADGLRTQQILTQTRPRHEPDDRDRPGEVRTTEVPVLSRSRLRSSGVVLLRRSSSVFALCVITQSRQPYCDTIPHKPGRLSRTFDSDRVRAVRIDLHTSRRSPHTSDSTAQRICCREPSPSHIIHRCRCTRCSIWDSHCCCHTWPFRTDIPDTLPHMPDIPEYTFRSSSFFLRLREKGTSARFRQAMGATPVPNSASRSSWSKAPGTSAAFSAVGQSD